ncbi:serine/threonine-protein kinase [Streptomyces cavernicola]|uniref:Serine/threonine-protein kinase n=1 Tax=Streptomyces cavernicola TaxID=3043613 RepID=A0ABT6S6G0_9ACTN|nr:serine/threonine-protein kinase [Streptomyces sp. B-S-A6]MDI3403683.1 serine/threonine-protein kinase [Streptomyces sp. B-S-A6]
MAETRLIQGRYRLLDLIGRGGMGEVWRARDESLDRQVAVKCLKPLGPQQGDPGIGNVLRERFKREARVAASLQHRGITVVHDFGEDDGVLYLVMELLEGRNLSQLMDDGGQGPLSVPDIVEVTEQIAHALAYTHDQSIIHRDLKPANIMRLTDGTVKICDFGIARLGHDVGFTAKLTGTNIAMGTPHYMSPEQIGGEPIDYRSDLYSLGCVLYEIATGAPPFDHGDAWAVLLGHRDTTPEPPRSKRPELPEFLEQIVLDLLAKSPDDRPGDARELAHRITAARGGTLAHPAPAARVPAQPTKPAELPDWTRGMTTGPKATGAVDLRAVPLDAAAGLTGEWISRIDGRRTPDAGQPRRPERSTAPPELLSVLATRHTAGLSLSRLGKWEEAVEVHRGVAAEREQALGADHPDTLASRYEVAVTLSRTGRPADALSEYEHVVRGRERALGADHPDTLGARQEIAYVLGQLGRHFEAHEVYTAVLAGRERSPDLGPDHPDTLRCRHNLAYNLSRIGRMEEAHRTAAEVAEARARVLGPQHPDTLVTRYEVAYALGQLGRWPEALQTYHEVAEARGQALGPDHPDTFAARYEVGISLGRLGRSADALALYRDLAADRARVHGADHPETLRARHGIGVNLGRLGRWQEALEEASDVCAARERALGADHPDTQVSRREVAVGCGWLGRWEESLAAYRTIADSRERALGAGHPEALAARHDEAQCLEQLGRAAEAAELYSRIAARRGS